MLFNPCVVSQSERIATNKDEDWRSFIYVEKPGGLVEDFEKFIDVESLKGFQKIWEKSC